MTHVSLFTGIGGLDLAAEWAGFETVLQVEREPYCLNVLAKHWPAVKRITDIREVTSESVDRPVDIVSGGFPCQPFSHAGERRGTKDNRYLWPEMLRVVRELSPRWVVAENVSGLLSLDAGLVFERVLSDLEDSGYTVLPLHYPAAGVGALHRRDRVFIVAHAEHCRYRQPVQSVGQRRSSGQTNTRSDGTVCAVADPAIIGRSEGNTNARSGKARTRAAKEWSGLTDRSWWEIEPDVGRVAHGIPRRMDRLRALGNAVVPQQAYPIFAAIAQVERSY